MSRVQPIGGEWAGIYPELKPDLVQIQLQLCCRMSRYRSELLVNLSMSEFALLFFL